MKSKKLLLFLFFIPTLLFSQNRDPRFHDNGVVINGVRWATRNVGTTPGTFVDRPQDAGGRFLWNKRVSRDNRDREWDGNRANIWHRSNDPCPPGWRVPTLGEVESLLRSPQQLIEINGVEGMSFGRAPNTIFLPNCLSGYWTNRSGQPERRSRFFFIEIEPEPDRSIRGRITRILDPPPRTIIKSQREYYWRPTAIQFGSNIFAPHMQWRLRSSPVIDIRSVRCVVE